VSHRIIYLTNQFRHNDSTRNETPLRCSLETKMVHFAVETGNFMSNIKKFCFVFVFFPQKLL